MPAANGPNEKRILATQVELVAGEIDSPTVFVEKLNRELATGNKKLAGVFNSQYRLFALIESKQRVKKQD